MITAGSETVMVPETVAGAALELNTAPLAEVPVPATARGLLMEAPLRSRAPPEVIWIEPLPRGVGAGVGVGEEEPVDDWLWDEELATDDAATVGTTTPPAMMVLPV